MALIHRQVKKSTLGKIVNNYRKFVFCLAQLSPSSVFSVFSSRFQDFLGLCLNTEQLYK